LLPFLSTHRSFVYVHMKSVGLTSVEFHGTPKFSSELFSRFLVNNFTEIGRNMWKVWIE
jgi:hypothetical protein